MNIKVFILLLLFSTFAGANENFTKISALGSESSDNLSSWSCVKNNRTGQVWEVKTVLNRLDSFSYEEAANYVASVNNDRLCGYADWRLPTIKELNSLVDSNKLFNWFNAHQVQSIDLNYFPNTDGSYWSTTTMANNQAWYVSFLWGGFHSQAQLKKSKIRLVRGTQYFDFFDYSKLDLNGNILADSATDWACVKDNRNGLVWEVKTGANKNQRYSYDESVNHVFGLNSGGFCGISNWRLPDYDELLSMVNFSQVQPAVNTDYFPNIGSYTETFFLTTEQYSEYWAQANDSNSIAHSTCINFQTGNSCFQARADSLLVRLVSKDTDPMKKTASEGAKETVQKAYLAYYGRPGDPAGIEYWALKLDLLGGSWSNEIVDAFGHSDEFNSRFGNLNQTDLINNIYQQLFNRDSDPAGLAYFIEQLDSGQASLAEIAVVILNGALGDDSIAVFNKLTVADYFTQKVTGGMAYGAIETARSILAQVSSITNTLSTAYIEIDNLNT